MWRGGEPPHAAELGQISRPSAAAGETKPNLDELARSDVYGAALRIGLAAGDPIRRGNIVKPGDRDFLQMVLRSRCAGNCDSRWRPAEPAPAYYSLAIASISY